MSQTPTSGPNPPCEVGRNHPRDRHRMKPLADFPGVWECSRHEMFARIVPQEEADNLKRGDTIEMHSGGEGVVVRHGDERLGGVLIYYRAR
jgi:hypothetical protein